MMKSRSLLLPLLLVAAMLGPGMATAADEPTTSSTTTTATDPSTTDTSTDSAPLTLDQEAIDALTSQADESDDNKSVFEKASDFVTDNAPWFIIGIIVLAAIIAGILIMRGRPRKSAATVGTPKASKSNKTMRQAGGTPKDTPAQVPSASELRRRKRAAIQRSREEERIRRKAEIENRKAARRGGPPVAPAAPVAAAAAGAAAVTASGAPAGGLDPVEAEKQGARDQEIAAGAVARYGTVPAPVAPVVPADPEPLSQTQAVPAPVSPSQTAPAAGVVTPGSAPQPEPEAYAPIEPEAYAPIEPEAYAPIEPEPEPYTEPEPDYYEPAAEPLAETSILHEPSIENPGADAAVGNAAQDFLAGGAAGAAAGAAGGFAAARASRTEDEPVESDEQLDPVIAPEPGMAAEYAVADPDPVAPPEPEIESGPVAGSPDDVAAAAAEQRLRAKVAEIKATQEPAPDTAPEPAPLGPDADLSPGLAAVERRLSENSEERDRTLRDAEERLRRVEQRAEDAERRAAFAERLAQLKVEESEREKRLNDVVSGIDRAEQRAREAEERAEAAEKAAAAALERSELKPPEPKAPAFAPTDASEPVSPPQPPTAPAAPPAAVPAAEKAEPEPPAPERKGLFGGSPQAPAGGDSDSVNLNSATFEQLREAGLSVTQATRILAYRERFGGYSSVEDLEKVPGFPADLIQSLSARLTI